MQYCDKAPSDLIRCLARNQGRVPGQPGSAFMDGETMNDGNVHVCVWITRWTEMLGEGLVHHQSCGCGETREKHERI